MKKHPSTSLRMTILFVAVALQFAIFNPPSAISQALPGAGNCLQYDGIDDYVSIPSVQALNDIANTGNSVTYSAWVNVSTLSGGEKILNKMHTINSQGLIDFSILNSGFILFQVTDCSTTHSYITSSLPITINNWYHIAITHTYGSGASTKVYINGELATGSWNITGNVSCNSVNTNPLTIGHALHVTFPYWMNGQIDEVRIWNRALTQTEIRNTMCQKLIGNEAGLVGYWRFDETSGTTVVDSSPNGNNGTLW